MTGAGRIITIRPAPVIVRSHMLGPGDTRGRCALGVPDPRRTKGLRTLAALALAVVFLAPVVAADAATPSPAPAPATSPAPDLAGNVTFGLGPATRGAMDTRRTFSYLQARRGAVSDQVGVLNLSERPLTLNLYAVDALNQTDGTLGLQLRGTTPRDLASWITLRTPTGHPWVVVPPRSTVYVPFTVLVPANAYVGDHLAGIVASLVAKGETPGRLGPNIALEQRVGIRVALRVAGKLRPHLAIEDLTADYVGGANPLAGSAIVTYTVRNTGNVRLAAHQHVTAHGLLGSVADAGALVDVPLLMPGGSAEVSVVVPSVPPLVRMSADVEIEPLSAAGDANPRLADVTESTTFWAVPWLVLGALVALALVVLWRSRRRRALPPGGSPPAAADVGPDSPGGLAVAGVAQGGAR